MIRLHPVPEGVFTCPSCGRDLKVEGWYVPGMRTLADLSCPGCGKRFYGDLPSGFGLQYPTLLDRETGDVHDSAGVPWFAELLRRSYAERTSSPVDVEVEELASLERPVLLDCLDALYGHSLLKLLNAQYYLDHEPEFDLVVLVPRFLRWLVPEGVAAVWTVDLPLARGAEWNDSLAGELKRRLEPFEAAFLSLAFPHPPPSDYAIERFTGVAPRPIDVIEPVPAEPTITFVWRDDRHWRGGGRGRRHLQEAHISRLTELVLEGLDRADVAVTGVGEPAPERIVPAADLRHPLPDAIVERSWCERYRNSDVVVGVHGSNMLLPSAYAVSAVELVPADRLGNVGQSLLARGSDARDVLYRYRSLPLESSPEEVAAVVVTLVRDLPLARVGFLLPPHAHETVRRDPQMIADLRRRVASEN